MAKQVLTPEQQLAKIESDLDIKWRDQEDWYLRIYLNKDIKNISVGERIKLRLAYRDMCFALCNMQICRNMLKREIENERETENGNQT